MTNKYLMKLQLVLIKLQAINKLSKGRCGGGGALLQQIGGLRIRGVGQSGGGHRERC